MTQPTPQRNPFWSLLVLAAGTFCLSVMGYVVSGFGAREAPLNQFFSRHGAALTTAAAIVTILFAGLAMTVDRLQTRRRAESDAQPDPEADTFGVRGQQKIGD